jgi:ABC-type transport system involved in multi-copper enzyme maturation permease subunit
LCITLVKNATFNIRPGIWIPSDPTWNAAEAYEHYIELVGEAAVSVYSTSALGLTSIVAFILPTLVMFSIARAFEDGSFQTQLSYPLGRSRLLLTRVVATLGLLGLMTSVSMFVAVSIISPGTPRFDHVFLIQGALWAFMLLVITSSTLIALLVKKTLVGMLIGVPFWLGIGVMRLLPEQFTSLENLLNPMWPINDFFNFQWTTDVLFNDLVMYVIGTIALAFSLLMICIVYFEQVEV